MMYPRTEYQMSEKDLAGLLDACKPTPVMMIGSYVTPSPQENANRAWAALGQKMGFDSDTVRPVEGKGTRWFTAVPSETETQREERVKREAADEKRKEVETLEREIGELQSKVARLREDA